MFMHDDDKLLGFPWWEADLPYIQAMEAWATFLLLRSQWLACVVAGTEEEPPRYRGHEVLEVGLVAVVVPGTPLPGIVYEGGSCRVKAAWNGLRPELLG